MRLAARPCGCGARTSTSSSRPAVRAHAGAPPVLTATGEAFVPEPVALADLAPQVGALAAIGVTTAFWWYVLVPSARVNLAANKRSGALRSYLQELKEDDSRPLERWFYSQWLEKVDPETRFLLRDDDGEGEGGAGAAATRLGDTGGVASDAEESLEEVIRRAKKTPRFWSGDNPVLVGASLSLLSAAVAGAITGQ